MSLILNTPITGPKAWRGADLAADTSWIVMLTEAEIADLDRALTAARVSGRAVAEIDRATFPLTVLQPRLEQALTEMRDGRGFLVLRGVPVERYSDDEVGLIFWGLGRYTVWPLSAEFPSHMGYKPAQDTPILVETEA